MGTTFQYFLPALPLLAFLGLLLLFLRRSEAGESGAGHGWRDAFVRAAVVWATLVFVFTEALSLRSALNALSLSICWGVLCIALLLSVRSKLWLGLWRRFRPWMRKLQREQKALLFWVVLSLALTALIAFVAPPNEGDSMTYHMSRVAHWWANNSVAFYPTNIQRQLYMSPLAEYIILQFFVLGGGSDRLANLVQWFCFGGCAIVMSLVAQRLGGNRLTQLLVAFLVVTTPVSIHEATSTQNDVVCAFFTALTLYFLFCEETVLTGISFGLALLTKSPSGFLILPFMLLVFFREGFGKHSWLKTAGKLVAVGCIALALNLPHWARNSQIFENPLGYTVHVKWVESQTYAPGPFAANLMRALATELVTPVQGISRVEERAIRGTCKILGIDPDDPRNTFQSMRFSVGVMSNSDMDAANPLQIGLLIAATAFLVLSRRRRFPEALIFAICIWAGFLLLTWRLCWQPYLSRLHAPFLVLSSLPVAVFLEEGFRRFRLVSGSIVVVLALASLFPPLHNDDRPLVTIKNARKSVLFRPREEQYFVRRPDDRACYSQAIEILSTGSCRTIGLKLPELQVEYPLWALARMRGAPIHFEHWDVENQTINAKVKAQIAPCATLTIHDADSEVPANPTWVELHTFGADGKDREDQIECKW